MSVSVKCPSGSGDNFVLRCDGGSTRFPAHSGVSRAKPDDGPVTEKIPMGGKIVKVMSVTEATHDVLRIVCERPAGYKFRPGQATDVAINKTGWQNKERPFTFTSLPHEKHLEFTIKTYPAHAGVTNELRQLRQDDELILHDVFGTIAYAGPGLFIAGGAGVTPFIAILRHLKSSGHVYGNTLLFANKTRKDIILEEEFRAMLGNQFINVLSDETVEGYHHGHVDSELLQPLIRAGTKYVYLCGPPPMMKAVEPVLLNLGVDRRAIIKENF